MTWTRFGKAATLPCWNRDASHADRLELNLRRFPIRAMLSTEIAVRAAFNYRLSRRQGIGIRKTIDVIIGTFCIEHDHRLLHDDPDFVPMHQHLGLQTA